MKKGKDFTEMTRKELEIRFDRLWYVLAYVLEP